MPRTLCASQECCELRGARVHEWQVERRVLLPYRGPAQGCQGSQALRQVRRVSAPARPARAAASAHAGCIYRRVRAAGACEGDPRHAKKRSRGGGHASGNSNSAVSPPSGAMIRLNETTTSWVIHVIAAIPACPVRPPRAESRPMRAFMSTRPRLGVQGALSGCCCTTGSAC